VLARSLLRAAALSLGWQAAAIKQTESAPRRIVELMSFQRAANPYATDLLAAFLMSDGYSAWQITIPGPLAAPLSAMSGGMLVYTFIPRRILAP